MIRARIVKRFPPRRESSGFTLDVDFTAGNDVTVLFGPSGAGKTLTLDALAGFVRPAEGRILLDDRIVFDAQSGIMLPPQARKCGYVFQNYALFPNMTLRQNLAFATAGQKRLERHRKVEQMLERFRLADVGGHKPHELSGGQKQRGSIARALIGGPSVLLLDEPARGLDATLRAELYEVLRQVRAEFGTPMVLVTHSLEEAFELGSEMIVLHDGRVVQTGTPAQVCDQPATLEVARLLGAFNVLPAEIRALDPGRNSSVLRYAGCDVAGRYYPGHLIGDRVHLCIPAERVQARPANGKPAPNEIRVQLTRAIVKAGSVRLEFAEGLSAEIPRSEYDASAEYWAVEMPARDIRLV